ncbi:hypothetical protein B9J77_00530 [candidate division NPL-UPA2 bacterium Unc8]|uniref:Tetratricopeptide repeat protein n=1 Tax=candidate division NPL-UPA2 bacterium Unc8 TaxID=1980939 RepID=A0A399FXC7_UNCN2|nr:MAG: hypothetical protein B9J77_00530 [candidate division NPL-UPA2 bacterium Unc8]
MLKFLFIIIAFLLIGAGSAYGGYIEHFKQGSEHFYEGRFRQAVAEFEESLRLNPLLDKIDTQLAREAMKYLEAIALEEEHLAEEIERLRAERISRYVAKEKIAALELEERIRLGIEEKERIRRLIEEEEARERLRRKEAQRRELERPKLEIDAGTSLSHIVLFNLDFERGSFPGHDPAPDRGHHEVALPFTDEHFTMQDTSLGFTLMPLEELSFTFDMRQSRTWGSPYWEAPTPMRDIMRTTVDQFFPFIILPRSDLVIDLPWPLPVWRGVVFHGHQSYKDIRHPVTPPKAEDWIMVNGWFLVERKVLLTAIRPMIVGEATPALVDGLGLKEPTDPGVPDTLWRDIELAYLEADFLGFEAKVGRQRLLMGLPVDVDEVTELIGIGVVEDLIGMVVGHADAIDLSVRTLPIMGLVSPRVRGFGMKLDDADPGICRIRSDHTYAGTSLGIELSVEGIMDMLGFELGELELPEEITVLEAARHRRRDKDLRDEVQSDILRLPIAVYVCQSGRVGVWKTAPDPVTGKTKPWKHYKDGPRHWVRSKEVGGHGWIGILPIAIPGDRMPFFAAIHKYRSGDDPATPNISEEFDPLPHDMLFMPLDPAALLPGGLPIALPEGFDIGTNMRYQLYAAGFRPSEELTLIGLYAELDRARLMPSNNTALDRARGWIGGTDKDFLQVAGLASIFTWRDIGFTLAGLGIRPEDSLYDAMQDMADEVHLAGLWKPGRPLPEPLVRSKKWMRMLIGMITMAPTEHTSLVIGGAWIDPRDHLLNLANAFLYIDIEEHIKRKLGGFGRVVSVTMDPVERFAEPFMDDAAMAFFIRLAVHF